MRQVLAKFKTLLRRAEREPTKPSPLPNSETQVMCKAKRRRFWISVRRPNQPPHLLVAARLDFEERRETTNEYDPKHYVI